VIGCMIQKVVFVKSAMLKCNNVLVQDVALESTTFANSFVK
jgi:hypothetical protein